MVGLPEFVIEECCLGRRMSGIAAHLVLSAATTTASAFHVPDRSDTDAGAGRLLSPLFMNPRTSVILTAMWSHPRQLAKLAAFYELEARDPSAIDDETFIARVEESFWGTESSAYIQQGLAIIAPACARRPRLTRRLLRHPIGAMIASGLDDPAGVIPWGLEYVRASRRYVDPTPEGLAWLRDTWPMLEDLVRDVFAEQIAGIEST